MEHSTKKNRHDECDSPSVKNKTRERDAEMYQTRKGNQWHFMCFAHSATRKELPETAMGELMEKWEHAKVPIRAKVGHPFHAVQNLFHHCETRYKGLPKNTA